MARLLLAAAIAAVASAAVSVPDMHQNKFGRIATRSVGGARGNL